MVPVVTLYSYSSSYIVVLYSLTFIVIKNRSNIWNYRALNFCKTNNILYPFQEIELGPKNSICEILILVCLMNSLLRWPLQFNCFRIGVLLETTFGTWRYPINIIYCFKSNIPLGVILTFYYSCSIMKRWIDISTKKDLCTQSKHYWNWWMSNNSFHQKRTRFVFNNLDTVQFDQCTVSSSLLQITHVLMCCCCCYCYCSHRCAYVPLLWNAWNKYH